MWTREARVSLNHFLKSPGNLALSFFVLGSAVLGTAAGGSWLLIEFLSFSPVENRLVFPPALLVSTTFLAAGSWLLQRARQFVRLERQLPFRRNMGLALLSGTLFVAVQSYGLWCLTSQQKSAAAVGIGDGAFAFALMHGLHFVLALLFVVFVLLRALADRYDHEYSWGVPACTWLWHALGIIWLVMLGAFGIASTVVVRATF